MFDFISIRILDIIDIVLVGYLLYKIYTLINGGVAIKIFIGFFSVYLMWLIVKALNMQLLSSILGQFMGVGIIALIIVFQQELRKFFLYIGNRYLSRNSKLGLDNIFASKDRTISKLSVINIADAIKNLAKTKTGVLIVINNKTDLQSYINTGEIINANITRVMIESVFFKNSPMHDGAMIIGENKIIATKCVLPLTEKANLHSSYGMRHMAAIGISEVSDAVVILVSEETGKISYAKLGKMKSNLSIKELISVISI